MLIGVTGSICAGKHTVAEYLVQNHGFLRLHLPVQARIPIASKLHQDCLLPSVTDEKGTRGLTFPDVDALLDFVTKRWREHWVLTDIYDEVILERLLMRPFFFLLSVDAAVSIRRERFNERCKKRQLHTWSSEAFVAIDDAHRYGLTCDDFEDYATAENIERLSITPAIKLQFRAHMHILNNDPTVAQFHKTLETLDLISPSHLRPTWDIYFMTLASLAAQRSNCMKRRVGCVLVSSDNRILATGYNGTPRNLTNCNAGGCARCNGIGPSTALSTCLCLHAEENALLEAGRERIKPLSVLYCDTCPCLTCSVKIVQVGIAEVVYSQGYNMDASTARVFAEAGVKLRQFSPPKSGLVSMGLDEGIRDGLDLKESGRELALRNGVA